MRVMEAEVLPAWWQPDRSAGLFPGQWLLITLTSLIVTEFGANAEVYKTRICIRTVTRT